MSIHSLGDLAQSFVSRRQTATLKQQMTRLTGELSSGRTTDVTRHLKASFGQLSDIEHQLRLQQGYRTATAEAAGATAAMQSALGIIHDRTTELAGAGTLAGTNAAGIATDGVATLARGVLDAVVGALNTAVGGRSLFAGTEFDRAPLPAGGAVLSAARAALGGASDAAGITAALDAFFGAGGGYETALYQGNTEDAGPFRLGAGESVRLSIRADDEVFRGVMKSAVLATLADDPALDAGTRRDLLGQATDGLFAQADRLNAVRADLGHTEERIERSSVRIASELTGLDYARGQLLAVDPFDAATELENVQFQLEALYAVTARAARLNLVNFLS